MSLNTTAAFFAAGMKDSGVRMVQAEVTATSPLTVRFEGTAVADAVEGAVALSTYTPAVNDIALLVLVRGTWIALGAIA